MYYLLSENKGADRLRGYHEAGLRLCIRICKKPVFLRRGSYRTDCPIYETFFGQCFMHTLMPDKMA